MPSTAARYPPAATRPQKNLKKSPKSPSEKALPTGKYLLVLLCLDFPSGGGQIGHEIKANGEGRGGEGKRGGGGGPAGGSARRPTQPAGSWVGTRAERQQTPSW
jgi:hypothetical protein